MNYCILNYTENDVAPLVGFGTIAPVTPDYTGLLLETIPPGFKIRGQHVQLDDIGIIVCSIEKIPEVVAGAEETPIVPIEPITAVYNPEQIKIINGSGIFFKNIIKLFEKQLVPMFPNKTLLLYNSPSGQPCDTVPNIDEILINFNCVPSGNEIRSDRLSFANDVKVSCVIGFICEQIYQWCVLDNGGQWAIMQGANSIIYVHWNAITAVSDAKILVDKYFREFVEQTKVPADPINFSIKKIANIYKKSIDERINKTRRQVSDYNQTVDNLRRDLIRYSYAMKDEQYKEAGLVAFKSSLEEQIGNKIQDALKIKEVISITPIGSTIEILTKNIFFYRKKSNETFFIGKFKITVNIQTCKVSFNNLAIKVNSFNDRMNAPHVFADGHACLGNFEAELPLSIKDGAIDLTCISCIEFLKSVNEADSAGSKYYMFPKVVDNKLVYTHYDRVTVLDKQYENGKEIEVS